MNEENSLSSTNFLSKTISEVLPKYPMETTRKRSKPSSPQPARMRIFIPNQRIENSPEKPMTDRITPTSSRSISGTGTRNEVLQPPESSMRRTDRSLPTTEFPSNPGISANQMVRPSLPSSTAKIALQMEHSQKVRCVRTFLTSRVSPIREEWDEPRNDTESESAESVPPILRKIWDSPMIG